MLLQVIKLVNLKFKILRIKLYSKIKLKLVKIRYKIHKITKVRF